MKYDKIVMDMSPKKPQHHILNATQINHALVEYSKRVSESFFGTHQDPEQIPITKESEQKLLALHPDTILYCVDDVGNARGWVIAVPTTVTLMQQFVCSTITEKELFDQTKIGDAFDALYLCSAFVMPEHRRTGCATAMCVEAVKRISGGKPMELFYWAFSKEGEMLAQAVSKKFGVTLHARK